MNIRKMRKLRDMTQKQLADAIGVDNSIISKYENNIVIPPVDRLEAIAQVLNVSLDALINDDNEVDTQSINNRGRFVTIDIDDDKQVIPISILKEKLILYTGGVCELCNQPAPFNSKSGQPYLEAHFVVWLSQGGSQTLDNIVVLCPNCHCKVHTLNDTEDIKKLKEIAKRHNANEIMKANL